MENIDIRSDKQAQADLAHLPYQQIDPRINKKEVNSILALINNSLSRIESHSS